MRMLNHPNMVKLLEVIDIKETLNIVMEYLGGTIVHPLESLRPNRTYHPMSGSH